MADSKSLIALEIDDELRKLLKRESYDNDSNLSATIRSILNDYFKGDNDSKLITLKVSSSMYKSLKDLSGDYGLPIVEVIEMLVEDYISRYKSYKSEVCDECEVQ